MKSYELPLSPNYVCNWGVKEAIRELLQNAIDGEHCGHKKSIRYNEEERVLYIINENTKLSKSSLVLGCSSKDSIDGMIGKFGEGYKLALIVLLRKGFKIDIINADEEWKPRFANSEKFDTQVLTIDIENLSTENKKCINTELCFAIYGIDKELYDKLLIYFPCIDEDYGNMVESENGYILLEPKFKGKMYVEGLYIQSDDNFKYGYNFNSDVVDLDRDRKAINYYELRRLTAASVVTAETCCPELFKAISDSYTDVKDITDVLDDASDDFLQQYRDMLYKEKGLEENTLVATESVMRQLEQMDIDMPIVKGTEIESYLIAKANDKLGLIYQAKEAVKNKDEKEEAFDNLKSSTYSKLMMWFLENKKYLTKKAQASFLELLKSWSLRPNNFEYIEAFIPEDFDYTNKSIDRLKEEILSKEEENL